jgi:hypothetical protein
MSRREELRASWAEYEERIKAARDTAPTSCVQERTDGKYPLDLTYLAESDCLEITVCGDVYRTLALSGDQAEKLYQFLGGLYG